LAEIALGQGKIALVDNEDYERVIAAGPWHTGKHLRTQYAWHTGPKPKFHAMLMHRFILDAQPGQQVDHINHDGLDNRRANLRLCSVSQNQANSLKRRGTTSKYKGVCRYRGKWQATITVGKQYHLGFFDSEEDAARAYDKAATEAWGQFATLNLQEAV
jgi:HNH endonuclease/AP2 domain